MVFAQDLLKPLIEVRLKIRIGFHSMRLHEGLDLGIGVPLTAIHLVSANMKILIWKEFGHLRDKLVEELVSLFACRIDDGIRAARINFIGSRPAGQFRISGKQ